MRHEGIVTVFEISDLCAQNGRCGISPLMLRMDFLGKYATTKVRPALRSGATRTESRQRIAAMNAHMRVTRPKFTIPRYRLQAIRNRERVRYG